MPMPYKQMCLRAVQFTEKNKETNDTLHVIHLFAFPQSTVCITDTSHFNKYDFMLSLLTIAWESTVCML